MLTAEPGSVHEVYTLNREQRYRGVRAVASAADDAADCAELLAALGLDPADGRPPSEDGLAGSSPENDLSQVKRHRGLVRPRVARGRY